MRLVVRKLLSEIEQDNFVSMAFTPEPYLSKYNALLEKLQAENPENEVIQGKVPMAGLFANIEQIKRNLKEIVASMEKEEKKREQSKVQPAHNTVTIQINGDVSGSVSFEKIISTIQNSKIGNKQELTRKVEEFHDELKKDKPDTSKLKGIMTTVKELGTEVGATLLAEAGKKFIGL